MNGFLQWLARPFRSREKSLTETIGDSTITGVRPARFDSVADSLTPERLGRILRDVDAGDATEYLTLAEEMEEREPHYASVLGVRKLAVAGLERAVESPTDKELDLEITDAMRTFIAGPVFGAAVSDLLDALAKGYSAVEITWTRDAKRWSPDQLEWRDPRFFRFDATGKHLRLRDDSAPIDGLPLAPYKWIVHTPKLKSGLPIRGGLARLAAASYACKSFTLRDWMAFAEVFGMPLRLGRYGATASPEQIRKLISAVAGLGHDAAAVIPDSMKIEFVKTDGGTGGPQLYEGLAEWLDRQVSKAVLGQTMTSDDGSSQAQATIHNEVRKDIRRADATQLAATIDRDLIRPFVDLNWGPRAAYPSLQFIIDEPEDLKAFAEALTPFIDRGLKVEESVIRDRFGLPDPAEGAEVLQPVGTPTGAPIAANRVALNREQLDDFEVLIDDRIAEVEAQMGPILDPIRRAVGAATSWEDLRRRLDEVVDEIDDRKFIEHLSGSMFRARGIGDGRD